MQIKDETTIYWQFVAMNMLKIITFIEPELSTIRKIEAYVLHVWETPLPLKPLVSYCCDV